jgi:hypothetical protein
MPARNEVRDVLTSRRGKVATVHVGLPAGRNPRRPDLRRTDVAEREHLTDLSPAERRDTAEDRP